MVMKHSFLIAATPLPSAFGLIPYIVFVFLQQDISVLFTGMFRRGDKVLSCLQPFDNLFGGLINRLSAFSIKVSHDGIQTNDADLCIIRKFQHVPANYRLREGSSAFSPFLFVQ
jgi:hypothetical protein